MSKLKHAYKVKKERMNCANEKWSENSRMNQAQMPPPPPPSFCASFDKLIRGLVHFYCEKIMPIHVQVELLRKIEEKKLHN